MFRPSWPSSGNTQYTQNTWEDINNIKQWFPNVFGTPPPWFHINTQRPPNFFKKHKCAFVSTLTLYLKNCLNKIIRVNVLCVNKLKFIIFFMINNNSFSNSLLKKYVLE